jgi:hypothetical protein
MYRLVILYWHIYPTWRLGMYKHFLEMLGDSYEAYQEVIKRDYGQ